jgi:hypothetical protein
MDFYELIEKNKKELSLTNKELGDIIGKKGDAFRMALNRRSLSELEKSALEKYFATLSTNTENNFILNEPKEQIANSNGNVYEEIGDGKYKIFVKKVPVKAYGSYLSHFQDPEFFDELKQVSFTVDHVGKGNYIAFEVQGNSMDGGNINDAPEGAELLCRELGRQHWKDGFRDCVYGWVIVHKETVLYKDITGFDKDTGDIICHSRSGLPQHVDFIINLNDVRQIWKVIKRSF